MTKESIESIIDSEFERLCAHAGIRADDPRSLAFKGAFLAGVKVGSAIIAPRATIHAAASKICDAEINTHFSYRN